MVGTLFLHSYSCTIAKLQSTQNASADAISKAVGLDADQRSLPRRSIERRISVDIFHFYFCLRISILFF